MSEWASELHDVEKDEWRIWTRGSFEEVVGDLIDFRHGEFGDRYDQARIVSPIRGLTSTASRGAPAHRRSDRSRLNPGYR